MIRSTTSVVLVICLLLVITAGAVAVAGIGGPTDSDDAENESVSSDECRDIVESSADAIVTNISVDDSSDDFECELSENGSTVNITVDSGASGADGTNVTSESETVTWDTENGTVVSESSTSVSQSNGNDGDEHDMNSNISVSQDSEVVSGTDDVEVEEGDVVAEDGEDGEDGDVNISTN
ncbi:hypothetical protein [Halostagnicola sp. A-GB9-2]|uniref:hypothetical protein n=1 Tax=Halostagnicola sp. A-GB9-2 TaxID=3048066 RepID=UPI0024BF7D97|nr:hypothetical protein [Halostagnicola sp. A-GB9-2]MDJ1431679.1 hypothetical protein [Halostagnicola sp. A-GB9-2]